MADGYIKIPDEVIHDIQLNTAPVCFHCGFPYIKDQKYCTKNNNIWRPDCKCLTTTSVRIVTG
jgi:hypothetical protein